MKTIIFAQRCVKEVLRDPINICFGLGFPLVLLLLLSAIQTNIPIKLFEINTLTPGITVFGLSFITLFSATLIAKDRESAFLQRLYTTPLVSHNYILGYMLAILPLAIAQTVFCYIFAIFLGLTVRLNILFSIIGIVPIAIFYIGLGLLCGSVFNVKQVGGLCGALLTNLSAWLSGIWFDLNLIGDFFEKVAHLLPFIHMVEMEKMLLTGDFSKAFSHFIPTIVYSVITCIIAIICFLKQMKKQ